MKQTNERFELIKSKAAEFMEYRFAIKWSLSKETTQILVQGRSLIQLLEDADRWAGESTRIQFSGDRETIESLLVELNGLITNTIDESEDEATEELLEMEQAFKAIGISWKMNFFGERGK